MSLSAFDTSFGDAMPAWDEQLAESILINQEVAFGTVCEYSADERDLSAGLIVQGDLKIVSQAPIATGDTITARGVRYRVKQVTKTSVYEALCKI